MWTAGGGYFHAVPTARQARGPAQRFELVENLREKKRVSMHRYREKMKQNPHLLQLYRDRQRHYDRKYNAKKRPRKE